MRRETMKGLRKRVVQTDAQDKLRRDIDASPTTDRFHRPSNRTILEEELAEFSLQTGEEEEEPAKFCN